MTADPAIVRALALGPESSAADHTVDITTVGARTDQARRIEVWFHRVGGRWYLAGSPGPRGWYANLLVHPRFAVHLKHGARADLAATAVPIRDEETRRAVFAEILEMHDRARARRPVRGQRLDEWLAGSPLVEIVFDDAELSAAASEA